MTHAEYRVWHDGEFVRVEHATGFCITPELLAAVWRDLAAMCRRMSCSAVLVEGDALRRDLRPLDSLDSAAEASRNIPGLILAICLDQYVTDPQTELFITASARRGATVQFFSRRAEALAWLRQQVALRVTTNQASACG